MISNVFISFFNILNDVFMSFFNILNNLIFFKICKIPFIILVLFLLSIYFSIKLKFVAQRHFFKSIKLIFKKNDENKGLISIIQSILTTLSSCVAVGNIVGVSVAILTGGPGAIFWMLCIAFLGMNTAFAENLLATTYKKIDKKEKKVDCAPVVYIKQSLADLNYVKLGKILSVMYAILYIIGYTGTNLIQNKSAVDIILSNFSILSDYKLIISFFFTVIAFIFSIKGIVLVSKVAPKITMSASLIYLLTSFIIIIINIKSLPSVLYMIIREAFNFKSIFGGIFGVMAAGLRRASYSNDTGIGTVTTPHAASKNDNAVEEAFLGSLNPFFDTIIICFISALVILITGVYDINGINPSAIDLVQNAFSTLNYYCKYIILYFIVSIVLSFSILSFFNVNNILRIFINKKYLFIFYLLEILIISFNNFLDFNKTFLISDVTFFLIGVPNIICLLLNRNNISNILTKYQKENKK